MVYCTGPTLSVDCNINHLDADQIEKEMRKQGVCGCWHYVYETSGGNIFLLVLEVDEEVASIARSTKKVGKTPSKFPNVHDFGMKMYTSQPFTA